MVFSLSEDSSIPLAYDIVRLRGPTVPVRLRTPLERARPRDGESDEEDVEGEVASEPRRNAVELVPR